MMMAILHKGNLLGKPSTSKTDEFSEKFQTAFDPPLPPHYRKIILRFFLKKCQKVRKRPAQQKNA